MNYRIVLKDVMRGIGELFVYWNVYWFVFDKFVIKLLVNVYMDVYRDDMVIYVRDVVVFDVLKMFVIKMVFVLGVVYKIGWEINVIVSIIYKRICW